MNLKGVFIAVMYGLLLVTIEPNLEIMGVRAQN